MAVLPSSLQCIGHGRGGAVSFVAWVVAGTFSRVLVLCQFRGCLGHGRSLVSRDPNAHRTCPTTGGAAIAFRSGMYVVCMGHHSSYSSFWVLSPCVAMAWYGTRFVDSMSFCYISLDIDNVFGCCYPSLIEGNITASHLTQLLDIQVKT
jgi:hypothetical protein